MNEIKDAGYQHVAWDIDTNDWNSNLHSTLLSTMMKDIC